jgi:hypothetical protein
MVTTTTSKSKSGGGGSSNTKKKVVKSIEKNWVSNATQHWKKRIYTDGSYDKVEIGNHNAG